MKLTHEFAARPGSRLKDKDVKRIAPRLEKLIHAHGERLKAEDVLADAKDPKSPLHQYFEWDDAQAGEAWRLSQARMILNSIRVRTVGGGREFIPMYLNITEQDESGAKTRSYVSAARVIEDRDLQDALLRSAQREMEAWISRFRAVEALCGVIKSAEKVVDGVKRIRAQRAGGKKQALAA